MDAHAPREPTLSEIRARHPDWDIHEVFGSYFAVPAGTPFFRAMFLSSLDAKLSAVEAEALTSERP